METVFESELSSSTSPKLKCMTANDGAEPLPPRPVRERGFTVLAEPKHDIVADVIFIHGLLGHPEDTFTKYLPVEYQRDAAGPTNVGRHIRHAFKAWIRKHQAKHIRKTTRIPKTSLYWPRDLLPVEVTNIRILTFGYNAQVFEFFGRANHNGISQHAQDMLSALQRKRKKPPEKDRPIIFVTHSLGGIIVKDALRRAKELEGSQPKLYQLFQSAYAVIFLGCPHRGSDHAEFANTVSKIARVAFQYPNKRLLKSLVPTSELLEVIQNAFATDLYSGKIRVHSFYEAKGMSGIPGFRGKVVEPNSALIGDAAEVVESIDDDHSGMAKFAGFDDEGYKKVSGVIEDYVDDIIKQSHNDDNYHAATGTPASKVEKVVSAVQRLGWF